MTQTIGFASFPKGWEGPVVLDFERYTDHSRVVRYLSRLENRQFDLYVPKFLLPIGETPEGPPRLRVAIGRSRERFRTMGFLGKTDPFIVGENICTYDLFEVKANSIRYVLNHEGQGYDLYVPNEVFAGDQPPQRVFLLVEVPETLSQGKASADEPRAKTALEIEPPQPLRSLLSRETLGTRMSIDIEFSIWLASKTHWAHMSKVIQMPVVPRVGEFLKFRNTEQGDYFAWQVSQVTYRESGDVEVCTELLNNIDDRGYSFETEAEFDEYFDSYLKEGWVCPDGPKPNTRYKVRYDAPSTGA